MEVMFVRCNTCTACTHAHIYIHTFTCVEEGGREVERMSPNAADTQTTEPPPSPLSNRSALPSQTTPNHR